MQGPGEQNVIRPQDAEALLQDAQSMALQPDSLQALADAYNEAMAWQARASRLFAPGAFFILL